MERLLRATDRGSIVVVAGRTLFSFILAGLDIYLLEGDRDDKTFPPLVVVHYMFELSPYVGPIGSLRPLQWLSGGAFDTCGGWVGNWLQKSSD